MVGKWYVGCQSSGCAAVSRHSVCANATPTLHPRRNSRRCVSRGLDPNADDTIASGSLTQMSGAPPAPLPSRKHTVQTVSPAPRCGLTPARLIPNTRSSHATRASIEAIWISISMPPRASALSAARPRILHGAPHCVGERALHNHGLAAAE
jgi:hypothetical protein